MSIALNALKDTTWNHKRKLFIGVLLFSIVVHFLGGIAAAVYVVMEYFAPPKAQFVANKQLVLPPQIIDPNLVAEFEAAAWVEAQRISRQWLNPATKGNTNKLASKE